ncbi:hypothetical protein EGW08_013974 [Elysia chlorotica]|uniref:Uncharacterized protein n=1 Tax=Elysia chlorotica TaxID=188477 RepID=A0A433T9N5_ELYCH|nr:hypothetical protein EGW08_013974 [Elysia chlorotica]
MRRPSHDAGEARNSPHMNSQGEDLFTQNRERRKSIFPSLGSKGARGSIRPGMGFGLAAMKAKAGAGKNLESEREKSGYLPPANLEPTYRMEPNKKFCAPQVYALLKQTLENHLDGFTYNSKFTPTMTKVLSDEIKERTKAMNVERYKLVVSIVMGERKDQGVMISSRAAWDSKLDSYATYTFQNKSLFCTASVYGVYAE